MDKVIVSFRIDSSLRDMVNSWARDERRTLANFIEDMIHRECNRRNGEDITLDKIDRKLDSILDRFSENKKRGTKNSKGKEKKLTAYDAWEDCGVCTKENWERWINHLHACGIHLNHYMAEKHFEKLIEINNEEWDCDDVIEYVITAGHRKFYVPDEWVKKVARR